VSAVPGPAFEAAYAALRDRYAHLTKVLAPVAVPGPVRPSVIYGWSRDNVPMEVLVRAYHFQAHGLPIVLHGTPYEMTP
jgi:hypothetical protein